MVTLAPPTTTTDTTTYAPNQLHQAPLAELQPDPKQPRKYMDPAALQRLMDDHAYQQDQLATIIGKSQPTILESLSLNRLPKAIRDECRQDPTVPKRTLIEIARKKQERSMLTEFKKFRDQQAKIAAKETGTAVPAERKRTKAEAIANAIGIAAAKIGDLEFSDFSKEDRTMIIDAMNSMKETLDEAIPRAVKNKKKPM
jgi:ParB family transcriptional regulator, chromosome partitioning protein